MNEPEIVNRLILPPEEAEKFVARSSKIYLRECPCRAEMKICPHEKWEVCLLFVHAPEPDRQHAREITTEAAIQIIRTTAARGDIHQLFYFQERMRPYELCNCCTCCCFPLREMKEKGNYQEELRCRYVAVTDPDLCTNCGSCIENCFFEARQLEDGRLHLIDERCFGCGRCIANCPGDAIRLEIQAGRGVAIPAAS